MQTDAWRSVSQVPPGNRVTDRTVVPYLVDRGFLDTCAIVDGDVEVINMSRRNVSFRVLTTHGHDFLVKQGVGAERATSVGQEALFLTESKILGMEGPQRHLPMVRAWDAERRILVFGLVPGARNLAEHQHRTRCWSRGLAGQIGLALRELHHWQISQNDSLEAVLARSQPPAVLSIHRPDVRVFELMSSSGLEIIKIVQESSVLCAALDEMKSAWQAACVIHGDMKWDNVVLLPRRDGKRGYEVQLVDWEMVQLGDPLWDVASFLSHYLDAWISSIPLTEVSPESQVSAATIPIERLQPAMRRFWECYCGSAMHQENNDGLHMMERVVAYAAARLIQFAIEVDQQQAILSASSVVRLQVAHNMVQRPFVATTSLLGLTT